MNRKAMLCISIRASTLEEAKRKIGKAEPQADLIEWRLDGFSNLPLEGVREQLSWCSVPFLFTLRKGVYPHSEGRRLRDIERLAALQPAYFDIEYDVDPAFIQRMQHNFPSVQLILSYHAEESLPPEDLFAKMPSYPNVLYKGVLPSGDIETILETLLVVQQASQPRVGICMGEEGAVGRILGPLFGNRITYAALAGEEPVAAGQLPAEELRNLYHFSTLRPGTALFGLIGDPVTQSMGHIFHNRMMKQYGLDAVYVKFRVSPDSLASCLALLQRLGMRGCSVTMPHKEAIVPLLDEIDPTAQAIGAVNTVTFSQEKRIGTNTDGEGAVAAIEQYEACADQCVVILGAGGAARAVAYVAKQRGADVTICSRDRAKAERVARSLGVQGTTMEKGGDLPYVILVNATPSPMPIRREQLREGSLILDMRYNPRKTPFLCEAEKQGARLVYGEEMFIRQAIGQLQTWFPSDLQFD